MKKGFYIFSLVLICSNLFGQTKPATKSKPAPAKKTTQQVKFVPPQIKPDTVEACFYPNSEALEKYLITNLKVRDSIFNVDYDKELIVTEISINKLNQVTDVKIISGGSDRMKNALVSCLKKSKSWRAKSYGTKKFNSQAYYRFCISKKTVYARVGVSDMYNSSSLEIPRSINEEEKENLRDNCFGEGTKGTIAYDTRSGDYEEVAPPPPPVNGEEVMSIVDEMPQFPGGESALYQYIASNVKYPATARENGIQGKCFVRFVVDKEGNVTKARILRGVKGAPECDKEALRVINNMPKWTPGKQNGKPVNVEYNIPINFKLQ